ncbi:dihydropteroate synthase [Thorsellia kenyensis]|uniref:Dihydropteroate synthase n=1 Tax=Thorsellia kenyensis TaxID=1549888 RepID=A0ABV6C958_9GAMM
MNKTSTYTLSNQRAKLILDSPKVMGILNVTPDSFSDGGKFIGLDKAMFHAEQMIRYGAELIDIGGESTRPGAAEVSLDEELARTIPVIEALRKRFDIWISIDTSKAQVMTAASEAGADLINDVRALQLPGSLQAAVNVNLPVSLMHRQGEPQTMQINPTYSHVTTEVVDFLNQQINVAVNAGIPHENILVDPGFGFGKSDSHNYQLLNEMEALHQLQCPILIGLSRKRMIQYANNTFSHKEDHKNRLFGSIAGALIAAAKGAHILRVHDVKETVEALSVLKTMQSFS